MGSVKDYYKEVSYGKLTINSVVTQWVQLPQNEAYYGTDGTSLDTNWKQMITDAIEAADTAGFDFSQGDSDGDGWLDCLTVIHSGHGQEYTGNPSTCVWSKQGEISTAVVKDGVSMKRCHMEPALRGTMANTGITRIGVCCHEMGHFFGLPDLYDYSDLTAGIGNWGIMASGSWNGSDGKSPAHFCGWSKSMLGFVSPLEIHAQGVSLSRIEDNAAVHLIRDGTSNGEYFMVENRAKTGFDNTPEIYPGLLIYHIDSKSSNNDLDSWTHPVVKIEEADGNNSLGFKSAYSQPGDVWTNTNGLAGGFRDQTGDPDSNAMLYQSSDYYNRADNSAYYSYIALGNFSAAGSTMTYDARTLKPNAASQTSSSPDYSVSWTASSNAAIYEIQEGLPVTLTNFLDSAESEDAMYENWSLGGTVKRDNGGARTGSYSYAMHLYYGGIWYSKVQSLTMKKPFKVTASTVVSFYLMSHSTGAGYLKCQISNDNGNTWKTLGTYSGYIDPWSQRTYNYTAISAAGISANDSCLLRFMANFEKASGWPAFPGYGYAVDDISITGTEIASYGNWTTLNDNVLGTSYAVSGRANGIYSYRVQANANGVWQGYGTTGVVTVSAPHTVTFQTDGTPGATLTGDTSQILNPGENGSAVTANAPANWHFVKWTKGGADYSTANPLTVTGVTETMTLTAVFALYTYPVTFQTDGTPGATLTGTSPQTINHGSDCTPVGANAPVSHHFVNWTKMGLDFGTSNPLTLKNVTEGTTLTAHFAINQYTLTYTAGAHGSIVGTSPQTVNYGGAGTAVEAVPETGYHFVNWSDTSTGNPRTDANVTSDITVTANFAINTYPVTFQTDGTPGATLTGLTSQTINHGSNCTPVTTQAPTGYHFVKWTKGGADYSINNPLTVTNVTEAMTLVATFAGNLWVNFGYLGLEDGSEAYPYNTLTEGVAAASSGGYLSIKSGVDERDNPYHQGGALGSGRRKRATRRDRRRPCAEPAPVINRSSGRSSGPFDKTRTAFIAQMSGTASCFLATR